jgi:hypothetical protein
MTNLLLAAVSIASCQTTGLIPINDLGTGSYKGSQGGLYPGGLNVPPDNFLKDGLYESAQVVPRNALGAPHPDGRIGLLTIGMSNTRQESQAWGQIMAADPDTNPRVVFVNGAQGGQTAARIADEFGQGAQFWANVHSYIQQAGMTDLQVQAIWLKEADANPTSGWPAYANTLRDELVTICRILRKRFPNARLCYVSSRTYGGYATTTLNPEPYAYESAFSVKWLIERQIAGDPLLIYGGRVVEYSVVYSPWLHWGPYLWADGINPRSDGLIWLRSDFAADGTHPSAQGAQKVGQMLQTFFENHETTRPWFVRTP